MNVPEGPLSPSELKDTSNLPLPSAVSSECMQTISNNSTPSFVTYPGPSNVPLPKVPLKSVPNDISEVPLSPEGPSLPPRFQSPDDCSVPIAVELSEDKSTSPRLKKRKKELCSDDERGQKHIHKRSKFDKMSLKLRSAKLYSYSNYLKKHNAYKIRLKNHKKVKIKKSKKQSDSLNVTRSFDEVSNSDQLEIKSGGNVLGTPSKADNYPEKPEAKLGSNCEVSKSDLNKETDYKSRSSASEGKQKEKEKKKSRKRSHKSSSKKKDSKKHRKSSKTSPFRLEGTVVEKRSRSHSKSRRHHKHSHRSSSTKNDKSPKGSHKRSLKTSEHKMEMKIKSTHKGTVDVKNKSPHKGTVDIKKSDSVPESKTKKLISVYKTHKSPSETTVSHHNRHLDTERLYRDRKSRKDSLILKLPAESQATSGSNRLALCSEKKGENKRKVVLKESKRTFNNKETPIKREQSSSESISADRKQKRDSKKHMGRYQSSSNASMACKEKVKDANNVLERRYQSKSQSNTVSKENEVGSAIDRSKHSSSHQTPEEKFKKYPLKAKGSLISQFKRHKGFAKSQFRGFGHRSSHFRQRRPVRARKEDEEEDTPDLSTHASKCIKSTPADAYYSKVNVDSREVVATDSLKELHKKFRFELVQRAERARALKPKYDAPVRRTKLRKHKPVEEKSESETSNSDVDSSSEDEDTSMEELEKKRQHPDRLHPELWYNDPKEMNDGPLCRCSAKARRSGIRHGMYMGEVHQLPCNPHSNNAKKLFHYKIAMTPVTNFLTKNPTIIMHDGEKYIFEGFSLFSHKRLAKLPNCKVIRFNYEYTLLYVEEEMPQNFTVAGLELFHQFLLQEILELVDLDWKAHDDPDGCPKFHFMPRFAKKVKGGEKELLSLNYVLEYLLEANKPLIEESEIPEIPFYSLQEWQDLADEVKGMIVTCPGMKPSSIRVDQLDREHTDTALDTTYPIIVHFGVRPPQLSYAGNPLYQKAWRDYVKYRHLLANKPKVRHLDRHKLGQKEFKLQEMRMENDLKRDVTVVITSKGFYRTGIMSDIVQHVMLLPVLVCHLRFHDSLKNLEDEIGYKFNDRFLLQLALTHPSYRENFGTNPDHARNSLTNCGLRQPQYGDRRIHYMNTRKRGINTLINIMSRFGSQSEATSNINHNERLEFLGDAVVEFLSSIHLYC